MKTRRQHEQRRRRDRSGAVVGPVALPDDFVALAATWLGEEAPAFLEACTRPPHLALRANALKGGLAALLKALPPEATTWAHLPWWPSALLPPPAEAARLAGALPARIGALYAQDPAALAAVAALDPQPGERVLDLCAAPGGKSTAIADRLAGHGLLVSNDVEPRRARELQRALERWGLADGTVLALAPERLAALAPEYFDRVLVDAPCSGEAMFARRDRALADWSPRHVAGCAVRQRLILSTARRLVRPGGLLVYATCTFNPSENEAVIAAHLAAHPDDVLEDATAYVPEASPGRPDLLTAQDAGPRADELRRCARLWPHRLPGAGHFVARLRVATINQPDDATARIKNEGLTRPTATPDDLAAIRHATGDVAPGFATDGRVVVRGDSAYLVPDSLPPALTEAAIAPGLEVAERRGRTWRPAHALAMALWPDQAAMHISLDNAAATLFLAGQPAAGAGSGVALATWQGYPLGWARARDGLLTPLLPKGLRVTRHQAM